METSMALLEMFCSQHKQGSVSIQIPDRYAINRELGMTSIEMFLIFDHDKNVYHATPLCQHRIHLDDMYSFFHQFNTISRLDCPIILYTSN